MFKRDKPRKARTWSNKIEIGQGTTCVKTDENEKSRRKINIHNTKDVLDALERK